MCTRNLNKSDVLTFAVDAFVASVTRARVAVDVISTRAVYTRVAGAFTEDNYSRNFVVSQRVDNISQIMCNKHNKRKIKTETGKRTLTFRVNADCRLVDAKQEASSAIDVRAVIDVRHGSCS